MNATPISQVEKATNIPDGSLYLVEMGDGSGTKTVTQETLIAETGKALKIGNMDNLKTVNKESLVEAINEAAQSGGGGTSTPIDILDTKEEIEANTEQGKAAGAQAVKEMFGEINDSLGGYSFGTTADGQPGYRKPGADTVTPFKADIKMIKYAITSAHLSAGSVFNINGLNPNQKYYLVLARGNNSSSGPTIVVQEPTVSSNNGCELLNKLGYGFYECIPSQSDISISIASVNGGGYLYQAICWVFG